MADLLFALALVVPPIVVVVCFALLALPVRREVTAVPQPDGNPARSGGTLRFSMKPQRYLLCGGDGWGWI